MSADQDPARWDRAIDMLQRCGDYAHTALLEACKAGLIDMVFVSDRKASLPFGRMRRAGRPVLLLVGDDDDIPTGPDLWLHAKQMARWARGAIVHGTGAKRSHYEVAVQGALACRQFLVVDTASRHAAAWVELLAHVQTLVIVPPDGEHPIAGGRETMH